MNQNSIRTVEYLCPMFVCLFVKTIEILGNQGSRLVTKEAAICKLLQWTAKAGLQDKLLATTTTGAPIAIANL